MRKVSPGLVCIVLGVVLLLAAGGLYAYNRCEDAHAGAEAQTVVADLQHITVYVGCNSVFLAVFRIACE